MVLIKKRNFKPYVIQWLVNKLNLGLAIGNIKYVADSSSEFYNNIREAGVPTSEIFSLPSLAIADCTASQNDVVMVAPGLYTETAAIAWSKHNTHMVGLGGPMTVADYTYTHVPVIYNATAAVDSVATVTGKGCQFHSVLLENNGADAANLTAFDVDAEGVFCKDVHFHGNMNSTQCAVAAACSLRISDGGFYPRFEDCVIGQNEWSLRATANSGQLYFAGAATAPSNGVFKNCRFLSIATTATVAMVVVPAVDYIGRGWVFDNCGFHNIDPSAANGQMNQVFRLVNTGSDNRPISLHNCWATGYTEWQTADGSPSLLEADMPITATAGGLMKQPTGTVGN